MDKDILTRFLYEEYKQQSLFDEIGEKGVEMSGLCVNNLDIILDAIGFPQINDENSLSTFSRDIIYVKYNELYKRLINEQKIYVSEKGLEIVSGSNKEIVIKKLKLFIDWLYDTHNKWQNNPN